MIVYFANRYMDILGMAATDLPDSYTLQHDIKKLDIDSGISTFEMEFLYQDDTHVKAKEIVAVGNYILRYHNDQTEFYTIIESEDDTEKKTIWVYAEDAGLDLLNEIVQPYAAASAQNIKFYIEKFTRDSGFEIGLNEVSDRTRTLSWDGSSTASERVRSVATQFDAEIGYRFDIDKLEVKHKYIDIYERRGTDTEQELRLGREVDKIVEKKSITNLCTCLRVTGGTPEGSNTPINLIGYSYDDGDIYVSSPYGDLKSRKALEVWSRYLSESGTGDGHIVGTYSYDTTDQGTLCAHAVTELKKRSQPAINYEVSLFYLPENLKIGDNVRIVDDNGELYLSARVLETEERICDKLYRATFGDFIIKDSGISDKVRELAEQFAQSKTMYTWVAYADDEYGTNISISPVGKKYVGIAANMLEEEVSISNPGLFSWSLIKGDTGTVFTPSVDSSGNISWTNDGGLPNPSTQNIKGPQGPEAYVNIEVSSVSFTGDSATLKAVLWVDGVAQSHGVTYKWTNSLGTTLGTNQTLTITTLDDVYHCECVWTGGSQIGSTDLRSLRVAGRTASDAATAATNAAKVATNYLSYDNSTGLDVGYQGTQAKARINGSGVTIYNSSGVEVASYGSAAVIGFPNAANNSYVRLDGVGGSSRIKIPVLYGMVNPQLVGYTEINASGIVLTGDKGTIRLFPTWNPDQPDPTWDEASLYISDDNGATVAHIAHNGIVFGKSVECMAGMATPYIQATGSASTSSAGTSVTQVTLNTTDQSYIPDSDFSYSSNGVKVAKAGKYRVTASAYIKPGSTSSLIGVYIRYGSAFNTAAEAVSHMVSAGGSGSSTTERTIQCGPKIITLAANDIVFLGVRSSSTAGTAYPSHTGTYLLIERIS